MCVCVTPFCRMGLLPLEAQPTSQHEKLLASITKAYHMALAIFPMKSGRHLVAFDPSAQSFTSCGLVGFGVGRGTCTGRMTKPLSTLVLGGSQPSPQPFSFSVLSVAVFI